MANDAHQQRWNRAAGSFDSADFVHRQTRDGLFDRLQPMRLQPRTIVDLGAATGTASVKLAKQFRRADVIAVDNSPAMLALAAKKRPWFSKMKVVEADARAVPLDDHSVDLVFCNLLLPHVDDISAVFAEAARLLRKDGLMMFSTLGPDTFIELRRAWQRIDDHRHVTDFSDMHDVGDAAVRAGLREPVLDVDHLAVSYRSTNSLFADLTAAGARGPLPERPPGLTGRQRFRSFCDALDSEARDGAFQVSLELVYGHCWGPGARPPAGEARVDIQSIGRRL